MGDIVVDKETRERLLSMAKRCRAWGWPAYSYEFAEWAAKQEVIPDAEFKKYENWIDTFLKNREAAAPQPVEDDEPLTGGPALAHQLRMMLPERLQENEQFLDSFGWLVGAGVTWVALDALFKTLRGR